MNTTSYKCYCHITCRTKLMETRNTFNNQWTFNNQTLRGNTKHSRLHWW